MRLLYGRHYRARMAVVAAQVPDGASVFECCCGPATMYRRYLRARTSTYVGLDVNPRFVTRLQAEGIDARRVDLRDATSPLPVADVGLIQASLYHFLPDAASLLERMLIAARSLVIVSEPIRNLSTGGAGLLAVLARRNTDPGVGGHHARFDERSLDDLMHRYAERVRRRFILPGGREKAYVLDAQ